MFTVVALVAWGLFAFGSVYRWAFLPLWSGCAAAGVVLIGRSNQPHKAEAAIVVSFGSAVAAILLQLLPVPCEAAKWLSPASEFVLRQYEVGYGVCRGSRPLSIAPAATMVGLAGLCALGLLYFGLVRGLTDSEVRKVAAGITAIGIFVAIVAIVQKVTWNGKIYGFWQPYAGGDSAFGPFVNRNHFAGWMLMGLPVSIAYVGERIRVEMRKPGAGLRRKVLWLSSPEASKTILVSFGVLLMATAHVMTLSRSGICGMLAGAMVAMWFLATDQSRPLYRIGAAACIVCLVLTAITWEGEGFVTRFGPDEITEIGGRIRPWVDAIAIYRQFWLTGAGFNTYGIATFFYQNAATGAHYAEAHNDYLQLLAEGGLLLGIPAVLALFSAAIVMRRRLKDTARLSAGYWLRVGAITGIVAIAVQEIADFSLQIPGNAVLFVVLFAVASRKGDTDGAMHSRWGTA